MLSIINPKMKLSLTPRWPLQRNQGKEGFKGINIPKQKLHISSKPKRKIEVPLFPYKIHKISIPCILHSPPWVAPWDDFSGYLWRPSSPLLHHFPHESCLSLTALWALLCQHSACSVMYSKQSKLPVCCSSELEHFEETHRQRVTESTPWGRCKSAVLAIKLLWGSSEAACGKILIKERKKESQIRTEAG